jgi:peptidoglycan/LPS O-acetylase OafA/YrhL
MGHLAATSGPVTSDQPLAPSPPPSAARRNVYIDTLRAVAIVRVYLLHALWIGWLTVVYPSMSIMFALGGTLIAASMDRGGSARTVWSRLRRLLLPLWVLAAVAVPLLLVHGWRPEPWSDVIYWVFPLANPPAGEWGGAFTLALWYIRVYLWFVLLSPVLWWAFRRWPVATVVTPLAAAVVLYSLPLPVNRVGDVLWSTASYGTCWVLGFARYTRLLDRLPVWLCAVLAAGLGLAGYLWGSHRADLASGFADPLADTLWGTAFVLILMRLHPDLSFVRQWGWLSRVVTALNARAVTIYLWHLPMLFAATTLISLSGIQFTGGAGKISVIALGAVLTAVIVVVVGWIEDVAARRRPALNPARRPEKPASSSSHTPSMTLRVTP